MRLRSSNKNDHVRLGDTNKKSGGKSKEKNQKIYRRFACTQFQSMNVLRQVVPLNIATIASTCICISRIFVLSPGPNRYWFKILLLSSGTDSLGTASIKRVTRCGQASLAAPGPERSTDIRIECSAASAYTLRCIFMARITSRDYKRFVSHGFSHCARPSLCCRGTRRFVICFGSEGIGK